MAFWGIEVKPGKPYIHRYDNTHGRLHISQATLDYGPSTKKSVMQCNVGKKTPILLCSLLPEKIESCTLNLEFEEFDEVIFSVLGPRSVHLTGYYLTSSCRFDLDGDDTDSFGEDIADTETDRSNGIEDKYDSDFIDDGKLEIFPSSPQPKPRVTKEETSDCVKLGSENRSRKRLRKKYQISDSEGDDNVQSLVEKPGTTFLESEGDDGIPLSSAYKSKQDGKNARADDSCGIISAKEDRKDEKGEDEKNQDVPLERKVDAIMQDNDTEREANHSFNSLVASSDIVAKSGGKTKKKKRNKTTETVGPSSENVAKACMDSDNELFCITEATKGEAMDHDMPVRAQELSFNLLNDKHCEGKKKKNKKHRTQEIDKHAIKEEIGLVMMEEKNEPDKEIGVIVEEQLSDLRTDGLVIEELSMGKPDGKRASHGNKVYIYYTGRLKKNGEIFDSNVDQKRFKFRLGKGRVIKGLDVGIAGMRIGDKRRLTIPPSLGYGTEGEGKIPGNAWLTFDVELVNVR